MQFFTSSAVEQLTDTELHLYQNDLDQLAAGTPLQYVLGEAYFAGMTLHVGPGVLIPRPETEEWFFAFVEEHGSFSPLSVVDWCTGSGCLGLAAKKQWPDARVDAFDVSEAALSIAQSNAALNKLDVNFAWNDLQNPTIKFDNYEFLLCNPPYIEPQESINMHKNVLEHEPDLALFAPNGNPLHFYVLVVSWCQQHLQPGSWLAWEINPVHAKPCEELLHHSGFEQIKTFIDLQGKPRAQFAYKP